jgi:hypothetical protein
VSCDFTVILDVQFSYCYKCITWHHSTEIEAEELKKKYHEEKQAKGTSNKEKKHFLKKCAGIDVEKPSLQHQSASSEAKRKKKLCDTKSNSAPQKKILVATESPQKQCPVVESIIDSPDIIEKTCKVGK